MMLTGAIEICCVLSYRVVRPVSGTEAECLEGSAPMAPAYINSNPCDGAFVEGCDGLL